MATGENQVYGLVKAFQGTLEERIIDQRLTHSNLIRSPTMITLPSAVTTEMLSGIFESKKNSHTKVKGQRLLFSKEIAT